MLWPLLGLYAQVPVTDANKNGVWVTVSAKYTAPKNMGFREGQSAVLALARKNAIEKASGFTITSFSLLNTRTKGFKWAEDYQRLIVSESNGKIIQDEPPKIDIEPQSNGSILFSIDSYRAKVIPDVSPEDPNFSVNAWANQSSYKVGEEIVLTMQASFDAYLTIFSIAPNGDAAMFLPNRFEKDNFVYGNDVEEFPDRFNRKIFSMVAKRTEGFKLPQDELFLIVATKEPVIFAERRKSFVYFTDILEINRWLMDIPRSMRAETFVSYSVRD
jgi:hypothetical protein